MRTYIHNFGLGNLKRKVHLEDQDVDAKIILEWILGKLLAKEWTG
jgi:hypothetical protein